MVFIFTSFTDKKKNQYFSVLHGIWKGFLCYWRIVLLEATEVVFYFFPFLGP